MNRGGLWGVRWWCACLAAFGAAMLGDRVATQPAPARSGRLIVHLINHAIGEERFTLASAPDGLTLTTAMEYADRGTTRRSSATLRMKPDYTAISLDSTAGSSTSRAWVEAGSARVDTAIASRTYQPPAQFVAIFGSSPFALQEMMMRYWLAHGAPPRLPLLSAAEAEPIEIVRVGRDAISIDGRNVQLDRYTVANLMFGREILWMDAAGGLAAAMTFAGGLPMEAVDERYAAALPDLYRRGVAQEMANLEAIGRDVPPMMAGTFAIAGATVIDGTGAPPTSDAIVVVSDGRISAVGPRGTVVVPRGTRVIDARGKTLVAGLWEMHTHYSGIEFGPALLASGITTARDLGGEFDFLVAQRDAIEKRHAIGPRLLLGGLVDAGGDKAFGHVTAETAEQGRTVVRRYHDAGFQQIKLYTFLTPDVIRAIADEAHRLGMTVTGHVPRALSTIEGVEAGMDQINHLNYVATAMRGTDAGQGAVEFFKAHRTVVDPTVSWGEMAGHSRDADVASFEPGVNDAPFVLATKFRAMGGATTVDQMRDRLAQNLAVIGALHKAGVAIVPGSDTGLVGYGLHREIELYVQAGMTPLEALQSATVVSARSMKLDGEVGTVQAGKRADLIVVDGDPLVDIRNLRRVSMVIANGRGFEPAPLWKSVLFRSSAATNH